MIKIILSAIILLILPIQAWSETLTMDDLVRKDDFLYYKKSTNVPFTGEISGKESGKLKNGEKDGKWLIYNNDGQLLSKVNYKNGQYNGILETYHGIGQLNFKVNFYDGKQDGLTETYRERGELFSRVNFIDGKKKVLQKSTMIVVRYGLQKIIKTENILVLLNTSKRMVL